MLRLSFVSLLNWSGWCDVAAILHGYCMTVTVPFKQCGRGRQVLDERTWHALFLWFIIISMRVMKICGSSFHIFIVGVCSLCLYMFISIFYGCRVNCNVNMTCFVYRKIDLIVLF